MSSCGSVFGGAREPGESVLRTQARMRSLPLPNNHPELALTRMSVCVYLTAGHRSFLENFTAVAAAYGSADVFMHVYYDPADPSHMRALRKFAEMPNVKAIVAEARNHALAVRHTLCALTPGLPTFSHSSPLASLGCRSGARSLSASLRLNTTRSSGG